jgi:putative ABC transport system permease protein
MEPRNQHALRGFQSGRRIQFTMDDYETLKNQKRLTKFRHGTGLATVLTAFGSEYGNYNTQSCHPDYLDIEKLIITNRAFLNDIDLKYNRKVIVIGDDIRKALFKDVDPVGEILRVGSMPFQIVGVYTEIDPREREPPRVDPHYHRTGIVQCRHRIHEIGT